jgi:hypothetical protein
MDYFVLTYFYKRTIFLILTFYHGQIKRHDIAGHWWLMPIILATWEAEIRRIVV